MLADKKNTAVIKYNKNLSEIIAIDKKGYHNKLSNYLKLIADIRSRRFDLVINLHPNERASAIAAFSGGEKIIGFSSKGFGVFFDDLMKERRDIHQADAYLEVLKSLNINNTNSQGFELWVDDATEQRVNEMWDQIFTQKVIGLNTGGSWPTKRWTKIGFARLADQLLEKGYGVAFFGGPMDRSDVEEILAIMKNSQHDQLEVFAGKTTLLEMAALVRRCEALVTGDSGPMHIAVSQGVSIIAIFGPSDADRYFPYGQQEHVLKIGCPCQPCGQHTCTIGHICMEKVTVEMVLEKLNHLLGGSLS